jgi:hypothetical protein
MEAHQIGLSTADERKPLPDDDSAWDYAESLVRSLLRDTPGREAWTVDVTEGVREVASIAFDLKAWRDLRSIQ